MHAIPTFTAKVAPNRLPPSWRTRAKVAVAAGATVIAGAIALVCLDATAANAASPGKGVGSADGSKSAGAVYTVKSGDTLSAIAIKNRMSVTSLAGFNGIVNADRIFAGQVLRLPATAAAQGAPVKSVTTPKTTNASTASTKGNSGLSGLVVTSTPGGPIPPELASRADRLRLRPVFARAAAEHGVPLELLEALTWHESGWQVGIKSKDAGAIGIGQLMPDTVAFVNDELLKTRKKLDPYRAEDNIRMSAAFLRYLLIQNNHDQRLALASYYQGLRSVREKGAYNETVQYVRTVLAVKKAYF